MKGIEEGQITQELKELIDAAVEASWDGDTTALNWLDQLPEETWEDWLRETLD